jgi:hypothetical protein
MPPLVVGHSEWGEAVTIGQPLRSIHVLGVPGMGKSTLLGQLAAWYAAQGCGVVVLDIKDGTLATEVGARSRLPLDRLLLFAPGQAWVAGRSWASNPLDGNPAEVVSTALDMFTRTGALQASFTQVREHLSMALRLALRGADPPTLHDLVAILTDQSERHRRLQSPGLPPRVRQFWTDFNAQASSGRAGPTRPQREAVASTVVRLDEWVIDEPLASLLAHSHSSLKLAPELDAGRLIVGDLVTGVPAEQVVKLGNLVMAGVLTAALARPPGAGRPWIVVADEFDLLAGDFFRHSLDKLRAAGLRIVAAHQQLNQLEEGLADSLSGVPIKLYFRPSARDVTQLQRLYPGTGSMWRSLAQHQVAVRVEDGEPEFAAWWPTAAEDTGWQVAETHDWPDALDPTRLEQLRTQMLAEPFTRPVIPESTDHDQVPPQTLNARPERPPGAAGSDRPGGGDPAPSGPPRLVGQRPDRIPLVSRRPESDR